MKFKQNTCPVPNGALLIIGGAEDRGNNGKPSDVNNVRMEVLECFLKLISHKKAVIEVITSASSEEPKDTFSGYERAFKELGAFEIGHIHHDERGEINEDLTDRISRAHGVFFSGGDQLKLTSIYGGTDFIIQIKQRYIHDKLVVAGTSAGAMALSTPMIYHGVGRDELIAGNVKVTTGLEFIRDVCIDTHFVERGRLVRIAQVLATNPTCIGIGIEEDTAIIVRNGTEAEVVGCGVIVVINGRKSYGTNITNFTNGDLITIRNLQVDILSKGEKFEIATTNPVHV